VTHPAAIPISAVDHGAPTVIETIITLAPSMTILSNFSGFFDSCFPADGSGFPNSSVPRQLYASPQPPQDKPLLMLIA
jgi:hypothetical protein